MLSIQNQSELRAPTAEKAAFYLDAALAAREDARGGSHVLFTLHVYQYRVEKCGRGGSRWPCACVVGSGALGLGALGLSLHLPPCGFSVWRPQPPAPH